MLNPSPHAMDRPRLLPWWHGTMWIRAVAAAVLLIAGGALLFQLFGNAQRTTRLSKTSVTLATVEQTLFHDSLALRAKVVALNTVYLDALEGGRVERVLSEPGDVVSGGQLLVELSNTELELDVLDREGRLIESITQLQSYQTQLEQNRVANQTTLAKIDYDIVRLKRSLARRKQLAARALEPAEASDTVQDELDHALTLQPLQAESNRKQEELRIRQIPQIQAQLDKLNQDLQITHSKLDNLRVRAPVAGRLTALDLKVGQTRNRGERFGEITPDTGNKLSAEVDEYYLSRVHNGEPADIESSDRHWRAKVSRVYPQVKNGTFTVDLTWDGAGPPNLLPGQALQGTLELGVDRPALVIPAGAFLERTGGEWIFVLAKNGKSAERRAIKVGRRSATQVEAVAHLAAGERVIISDYGALERVDRIELTE